MRAKHTALFLSAGLLLMPTLLWSQLPGGFGGGGSGEGRPRMDPDQMFDSMAKGQDVIRVDQLDERQRFIYDRFASRMGLSGNVISRDQFKGAMTRLRDLATSGQLPGGMNFQGGPGGGPGGGGSDADARIERRFQSLDKNQDGVLSNDELSETLQAERDKYDLNHDGVIDLNEYKAYVNARMGDRQGGGDNAGRPGAEGPNGRFDPADADEPQRTRPTIMRAGNLPRDFPYAGLDTDQDGQIGLYEWKAAGNPISEFLKMDLNNDGFLTVEEYYGWRKQVQEEMAKASGSQSGEFGRGRGTGGMMAMGPGGDRGFGRGTGGDRGFGMMGMGGPGGDRGFGRGTGGFGMMGGPGGDRGFGRGPGGFGGMPGGMGMTGGPNWGGRGGDTMMFRGPGGDRGGFGMDGSGGDRGFGRGPGGFGMGGGNWPGAGMSGGDRGFGRGPGGDFGRLNPGAGPAAFTPPGGDGGQSFQLTIPGGMMGPRGDRGPGMGGDRGERGPEMGGDRGRGRGGFGGDRGDRGERGDRPSRKDRR